MRTAYLTHPDCFKHDMGDYHPECPARMTAIEDALTRSGLRDKVLPFEAPKAAEAHLQRVHTADYLEWVFRHAPVTGSVYLDSDTSMNAYSLEAALRAAGAAVNAVDLVMAGEVDNAFCNIRPPGHHAGRANAAGFCIFNNVAIAAAHSLEQYGLQRVAVADFDIHHGDGTENIFRDDPRVMLCSTFRHPFYPYVGANSGNERIINIPLRAGSGGAEFREAVTDRWLPALKRFQPELVLISAGFDAHLEDDMGGLKLVDDDYVWVTRQLKIIAAKYSQHRLISMLEGGYALAALGRCAAAHVKCLCES